MAPFYLRLNVLNYGLTMNTDRSDHSSFIWMLAVVLSMVFDFTYPMIHWVFGTDDNLPTAGFWYMGFQYQYQYAIFHFREKEIMRSHFSDHKKDPIKFNTLRPKYNCRYFADELLNWWFYGEIYCILIQISLNIVPNGLIGNTSHVANGSWAHTPDVFKIICCL